MRSCSPTYFFLSLIVAIALCLGLVRVNQTLADEITEQPVAEQPSEEQPAAQQPIVEQPGYWVANEHGLPDLVVELGIGRHFKLGSWTEVRVRVDASSFETKPTLSVIALDSDGIPTEVVAPASQKIGSANVYRIPVKIGRKNSNLQFQFVTNGNGTSKTSIFEVAVGELANPISATDQWFLQIGPDFGLPDALRRFASKTAESTKIVAVSDLTQLPHEWYLLEGVNHLFWMANDSKLADPLQTSQLDALEMWIKQGGKVTLSVGTNADALIGQNKPLARFVPGQFREMIPLQNTTELEAMVNLAASVDRPVRKPLTIAVVENPQGVVRVKEGSRQVSYALWIRNPVGFGSVDFFSFDLSTGPIAEWSGREPLLKMLLESIGGQPEDTSESIKTGNRVAHYGFTDIAGQLRLALDQFPGVRNVSFFLVGAIIVIYLALIGPGDYFFLRRLGLRMEWTWITFPAIILLACVGIWSLATWTKGVQLKRNQIALVDIDLQSSTVRTSTWFHLFSPESRRYDIELHGHKVPSSDLHQLLSWQGLAGSGLGGMSARQSISTVPTPYSIVFQDGNASLKQMPIQIWSSKTLMGRGWGQLDPVEYQPLLEQENQLLEGTIVNPTDMQLTDCYLFHGRWAYFIAKLPPHGTAQITFGQPVQNTRKVLNRHDKQAPTDSNEPWDRQSTDIDRIMEVAMFYNAAGGRNFTNLTNRFQSYVDLSSHIDGNRAVLVGKVDETPVAVDVAGQKTLPEQSQTWSFVRVVVPVQKSKSSEIAQQ